MFSRDALASLAGFFSGEDIVVMVKLLMKGEIVRLMLEGRN
jgi:hypothetical protein